MTAKQNENGNTEIWKYHCRSRRKKKYIKRLTFPFPCQGILYSKVHRRSSSYGKKDWVMTTKKSKNRIHFPFFRGRFALLGGAFTSAAGRTLRGRMARAPSATELLSPKSNLISTTVSLSQPVPSPSVVSARQARHRSPAATSSSVLSSGPGATRARKRGETERQRDRETEMDTHAHTERRLHACVVGA